MFIDGFIRNALSIYSRRETHLLYWSPRAPVVGRNTDNEAL